MHHGSLRSSSATSPEALACRKTIPARAQTAEAVGELRSLEVERLDNLQLAVWQKAMEGDVPSAFAVVRCILARCRLLGLDGPGLLRAEESRPRTLVISPVP